MRAAPAVRVSVERFELWRWAVAIWAALAALSLAAWAVAMPDSSHAVARVVAGAGVAMVVVVAWSVSSCDPIELRWDGQCWLRKPASDVSGEPLRGQIAVSIDLGAWMLLQFNVEGSWRRRWVPLQRRGLEREWHALRCAIYSPRPSSREVPDEAGRASVRKGSRP